jgi:hypothetical protein
LQQWANGQWGGQVDFTRAMVPEFGQHPVTVVPDPDPTPEPDPEPIPEPEPTPGPEPTPEPPEEPKEYPVPEIDPELPRDAAERLGNILPSAARDGVYITYGVLGIVGSAITAYLTAVGELAPGWLVGGLASYAAVGPFIGILAKANLPRRN